jgi:dTDP-glucose pyrophosphorylase
MHDYLEAALEKGGQTGIGRSNQRELFVGDVVQAAIDSGMRTEMVLFAEGHYLDVGIPENLVQAIHSSSERFRESGIAQ